jgi:dipeptidyl aminopeptidase/acylaminoacyl peptidase
MNDLMNLAVVIDAKISPDGRQVAYVTSRPSVARNVHEAEVFVVPSDGGPALRIAANQKVFTGSLPSPRLRWSPDGAMISFLCAAEAGAQVCAAPAAGGDATAISSLNSGVLAYEWSPDSKHFAFLTRGRASASPVTHVDAPAPATRLVEQPVDGTIDAKFLTGDNEFVESFSWAPDGREIAYSAAAVTGFMAQYSGRLYAVRVDTGERRTILDRPGMNSSPQFSPDGALISFITTNEKISLMVPRSLAVISARGGAATIRSFGLDDAWVTETMWARDSASVFALTSDGTFGRRDHMFDQPIVRVPVDGSRADAAVAGPFAHYSVSISRDGSRMAYRRVGARSMGDIVVRDVASGRETTVTDVNPQLKALALGEMKAVSWKSFDGMEIWGLLLTPPNYANGNRVPLLTYVHGGPGGGFTWGLFPQFMQTVPQVDYYPVEALASAGFAILMPMPRGGAGYGEAGQRAVINDWGGADFKDIMTGIDALIAKGIADPDRLGIMGASYGGYMTDWAVTQTSRFKAASAGASISDLVDTYYLSDAGDPLGEYFGKPWEARASYDAHSPMTFADKVTTPLLIQHGERDNRAPIANAFKFYRALKQRGKTVELDVHPGSSHLFYAPVQEFEAMKRNLEWFRKWIPR